MVSGIADDMALMALTRLMVDAGLPFMDANKAAERWMADHPAKTEGRGGLMDCEGWLASATRPVWGGPMVVVLKNGNRGRARAMQTCDRLPALFQVQLSDNGVCEVRESEIDHYLTPPESKNGRRTTDKPEPSSRLVHLPAVQSSDRLQADKWLLLKTLEETAELVEAGKAYLKADTTARQDLARDGMLAEWADVLQTLANTATAFDFTDEEIEQAVSDRLERNRARERL